jgi:hypothetical protein
VLGAAGVDADHLWLLEGLKELVPAAIEKFLEGCCQVFDDRGQHCLHLSDIVDHLAPRVSLFEYVTS